MNKHERWKEELNLLRSILEKTGLPVEIKWGAEVFTHQGANVVAYGGFNDFFALWFYQGVYLKDPLGVLINAQEGKTKALRQWRFRSIREVNEKQILAYVAEAVENTEKGLVWKPEKADTLSLPVELEARLNQDQGLSAAFDRLTPYKQREYVEFILEAKRDATRVARLEKITPLILAGTGLHDQYKKGRSNN
ncbi:YdeI family protein [Ravibacter arvi]|uniref:YdeI family protein n=1 Tax=Ravibacter arvi TaxID=2051041 RepID=A0ABP8M9U0_9BACT